VVKSCPNWHITAVKFQRIGCTTCFTSPDTKETTPAGKGHACCLVIHGACCLSQAEAAAKQKICGCSARHPREECISQGSHGTAGAAGLSKRLVNRKADCCTLLKRITKLKCVNSAFRSVNIHPKKGCLQWLHGTMSEPPWKSH